jgi:hypothetical protein
VNYDWIFKLIKIEAMSNQGIKIVFLIVPFYCFSCKKELTEEQKNENLENTREQYFYIF